MALIDREAGSISRQVDDFAIWRQGFEQQLLVRKQGLVSILEALVQDGAGGYPGSSNPDAVQVLAGLVGPSHAATAVLACHTQRITAAQQQLIKTHASGKRVTLLCNRCCNGGLLANSDVPVLISCCDVGQRLASCEVGISRCFKSGETVRRITF